MTDAPQLPARGGSKALTVLPLASLVVFAALAAIVMTGGASEFDSRVRATVHAWASAGLTDAMLIVTALGSVAIIGALSLAGFAGFALTKQRGSAWLLALAMGGAIVLENGLKLAFHRARPEPFFGIASPETFSFPSGHALFSACFYGAVAWRLAARAQQRSVRATLWATSIALIAAIGFSRIYLGVHNPTDVLAGYLVAAFWLGAIRAWGADRITSTRP